MATETVILNCAPLTPDISSVGHIARLRLGLKRAGCELCLANVSEELRLIIDLVGLAGRLGVEVERQAEKREQPGGV